MSTLLSIYLFQEDTAMLKEGMNNLGTFCATQLSVRELYVLSLQHIGIGFRDIETRFVYDLYHSLWPIFLF